jgi:hypothetical protein
MVTKDGDVLLDKGQQVQLLFKFFSNREAATGKSKEEQERDENYYMRSVERELRPRTVKVIIYESDSTMSVAIDVKVVPRPSIIDHTFRFYEPINSGVTLHLPRFTPFSIVG